MMFDSIILFDDGVQSLTLALEDDSNGFMIANIDGLDPAKANISSAQYSLLDGAIFQSSKRDPRNIVMTIELDPYHIASSVASRREELYRLLMPKAFVNMSFMLGEDEIATIRGVVETFETPLFTNEPQAVVSIICFDPDFLGQPRLYYSAGVDLPYTRAAGQINTYTVDYPGSIPCGVQMVFMPTRAVSGLEFAIGAEVLAIDFDFLANDLVNVITSPGSKHASVQRSGNVDSIMYAVGLGSAWPKLYPGENLLSVTIANTPNERFDLVFQPRYGGL